MRMPSKRSSSEVLLYTFGIYHLVMLKSDPKTKQMVKPFETVQNGLETAMKNSQKSYIKVQEASAYQKIADVNIDQRVKEFMRDLLKEVNDNRKSPLFKKYFGGNLGDVTDIALAKEVVEVEKILTSLNLENAGNLNALHYNSLKDKLDDLKKAMETHQTNENSHGQTFKLELDARMNWHDRYYKNSLEIKLIYPDNKKKADSFFKEIPTAKKKKGGGDGEDGDEGGNNTQGSGSGSTQKPNSAPKTDSAPKKPEVKPEDIQSPF